MKTFAKLALLASIAGSCACTAYGGGGGGGGGGGSSVLICGTGGACPANMSCSANNVCVALSGDAVASGDAGASADGATQGADATAAADADKVDSPAAANDSAVQAETVVAKDTVVPDTSPPIDSATAVDSADAATEPVPATVAEIQLGPTSQTCENPTAIVNYTKVIVENCVVTGPPQTITASNGKKSSLFYMRPATGPTSAVNAGMAVIVGSNPLAIQPGDVVQVTGIVQEFYCQTEIACETAASVVAKGKVATPEPYNVSLSSLVKQLESHENVLLRISGITIDNPNVLGSDGKLHGEFTVSSGAAQLKIGIFATSQYYDKDAKTKFTSGQAITSISGHLTYSFGSFLLRPRDDNDIQPGF